MIIALFGGSACGKTTLAGIASSELKIPVRHCGKEIREAAAATGYDLSLASDDLHWSVDRQTKDWCTDLEGRGLVEGRFLDQVLSDLPGVTFVELTATDEVRAVRLTERLGRLVSSEEVRQMDEEDDLFRRRMYRAASRAPASHTIHTGGGTAWECGQKLIFLVSRLQAAERG